MADDLRPNSWIKELKKQKESLETEQKVEELERLANSRLIQLEGTDFWKQFVKELKVNIDELYGIGIGLHCTISMTGDVENETRCEINITKNRPLMKSESTSWTFCYSKKDYKEIRGYSKDNH